MTELQKFKKEVREAIANYICSEGCSCCRGDDHPKHRDTLGKLLDVRKYSDGSGYDFSIHQTQK